MNYWKVSAILALFLLLGLTGAAMAADVTVSGSILTAAPNVDFTGTPTSGFRPLTVAFTATNTGGTVDTWDWNFGDGTAHGTVQNPSHQYTTAGTYTVTLTATNAGGSSVKTRPGYITVNPNIDLQFTTTAVVNTAPAPQVFANEPNTLTVGGSSGQGIKNAGTDTATNIVVKFNVSDVNSGNTAIAQYTIPSLAAGAVVQLTAALNIADPTIRTTDGASIRYGAILDPDNLIPETNEANNAKLSTARTVLYNGYKGVQYWTGKTPPHTYLTYDIRGNLVHSFGDSEYKSGKGSFWQTLTWHYTAGNLPVPAGATVKAVRLYIPYCWDFELEVAKGLTTTTFNGVTVTPVHWENDTSNFGAYAGYDYGLITYDVTPQYVKNGDNVVTFTRTYYDNSAHQSPINPGQAGSLSPAGFTVAVVYEDPAEMRRQIFINEGWDILGAAQASYSTTEAEATSYQDFTGMTIDMAHATKANLTTFVPWGAPQSTGDPGEGNLFVNGVQIGNKVWNYGGGSDTWGESGQPQVAVDTRDILGNLNPSGTGNGIAIQSTAGASPLMVAERAFLLAEYADTPPMAHFSATPLTGTAPLTVHFTDASTGYIAGYDWDFENDGVVDSHEQNPSHTYDTPGTYTVKLTVTNSAGSNSETKPDYVTVTHVAPVAAFTWDPASPERGTLVSFDGSTSTGSITDYAWTFGDGDSGSGVAASHTYTTNGDKTVRLTVTGPGGSNFVEHTVHVKEPAPVVDFTPASASGPRPLTVTFTGSNTGGSVNAWAWNFGDGTGSGQSVTHTYNTAGTYTVTLTATGPDYTDVETKTNIIQVGEAVISVGVTPATIDFGTMSAGVDETGSTSVAVTTSGGTAWSVDAASNNGGHMKAGSNQLASAFQLANGGGSFQFMTSGITGFMTGTPDEDRADTANVKQVIGSGDQPGDYSIMLTFTGGFV